jgi:hypothetical protein
MTTPTEAIAATALAALLGWFGPSVLDAAPTMQDHSADHFTARQIDAREQAAQADQRRERAALAICTQHGAHPHTTARWTPDGQLVCTDKRGRRQPTPPTL